MPSTKYEAPSIAHQVPSIMAKYQVPNTKYRASSTKYQVYQVHHKPKALLGSDPHRLSLVLSIGPALNYRPWRLEIPGMGGRAHNGSRVIGPTVGWLVGYP